LDKIQEDIDAKRIKVVFNEDVPEDGEIYRSEGMAANAFLTRCVHIVSLSGCY
jgi:hypothetical protein